MNPEKETLQKLIFVYNADSGLGNVMLDGAHKILSPNTYVCSLCMLTYGNFSEKSIWKKFRNDSAMPMQFLHKDEFAKAYKSKFGYKFTYPIVLAETSRGLEIFIKTGELNKMEKAEDLINLIRARN